MRGHRLRRRCRLTGGPRRRDLPQRCRCRDMDRGARPRRHRGGPGSQSPPGRRPIDHHHQQLRGGPTAYSIGCIVTSRSRSSPTGGNPSTWTRSERASAAAFPTWQGSHRVLSSRSPTKLLTTCRPRWRGAGATRVFPPWVGSRPARSPPTPLAARSSRGCRRPLTRWRHAPDPSPCAQIACERSSASRWPSRSRPSLPGPLENGPRRRRQLAEESVGAAVRS